MGLPAFRLRKYYLDCVAEDGSACIAYAARLHLGPLALRYGALLECAPDGTRREAHTFRDVQPPARGPGRITWEAAALGVRGEWYGDAPACGTTLLEDERGAIAWSALAPRARAEIEVRGRRFEGLGYVERLELTIPPWHLPFDTLHWGRFLTPTDVLVWIAWTGASERTYVVHNGEVLDSALFGEQAHRFGGHRQLQLAATRTIHEAPIVSAVAALPRVLRRIPPAFASAREVKWLSLGTLSHPQRPPTSGWALHERVTMR